MASVADCAKEAFIRYYDSVMPLLRHALTINAGDKQTVSATLHPTKLVLVLAFPRFSAQSFHSNTFWHGLGDGLSLGVGTSTTIVSRPTAKPRCIPHWCSFAR